MEYVGLDSSRYYSYNSVGETTSKHTMHEKVCMRRYTSKFFSHGSGFTHIVHLHVRERKYIYDA